MKDITPFAFALGKVKITRIANKGRMVRHVLSFSGNESRIVLGKGKALEVLKEYKDERMLVIFNRYKEGDKQMARIKAIYARHKDEHESELEFIKKILFLISQLSETRLFPSRKMLSTYKPLYLQK